MEHHNLSRLPPELRCILFSYLNDEDILLFAEASSFHRKYVDDIGIELATCAIYQVATEVLWLHPLSIPFTQPGWQRGKTRVGAGLEGAGRVEYALRTFKQLMEDGCLERVILLMDNAKLKDLQRLCDRLGGTKSVRVLEKLSITASKSDVYCGEHLATTKTVFSTLANTLPCRRLNVWIGCGCGTDCTAIGDLTCDQWKSVCSLVGNLACSSLFLSSFPSLTLFDNRFTIPPSALHAHIDCLDEVCERIEEWKRGGPSLEFRTHMRIGQGGKDRLQGFSDYLEQYDKCLDSLSLGWNAEQFSLVYGIDRVDGEGRLLCTIRVAREKVAIWLRPT